MNDYLDPPSANALVAAVQWLEGALLGRVATTVAIIAVASVGLLLLSGRIDLRRGAQVIMGCFILFGASVTVDGIMHVTWSEDSDAVAQPAPSAPIYAPPPALKAAPYDPYAGAALPSKR